MTEFKISKAIPNAIDIALFVFIGFSIYFKNHPITSLVLLLIPCFAMWALIVRQSIDCWKQKSVYNFTMLVTAMTTKAEYSTKVVRDLIIYGLHFYLYSLNPNDIYLASFGICLVFDLMVYNAAFNPMMKNYVLNKTIQTVNTVSNPAEM